MAKYTILLKMLKADLMGKCLYAIFAEIVSGFLCGLVLSDELKDKGFVVLWVDAVTYVMYQYTQYRY